MKNSVFHGKKGRVHASGLRFPLFALLLASLIVLLCGCDEKAKDNAISDRQTSEGREAVVAGTSEGREAVVAGTTEGGEAVVAGTTEGGEAVVAGRPEDGEAVVAGRPEDGEPVAERPPKIPQSSANDELTITINGISGAIQGFSNVIDDIKGQMETLDKKLTQILNQNRSGVSMPVFIVSLLLVSALNAGLTALVANSFTRKFRDLEAKLDEQNKEAIQRDEALESAISDADSQEALEALAFAVSQCGRALGVSYQNTDAQNAQDVKKAQDAQGIRNAQTAQGVRNAQDAKKAQSVAAAESAPEKSFYQAFPPRSNAGPTILDKSETHQPLVGWMSSGTLILEPSLDKEGTCSRDALYSEQMTACFSVQPPAPIASLNFYRVEIVEPAKATLSKGKYELRVQGSLIARS